MYDKYPIHDVPNNNLVQRFFSQRFSAILLEIVMTVVITVAAGAAFDIFDPLDRSPTAAAVIGRSEAAALDGERSQTLLPLDFIKGRGAELVGAGRYAAAEAVFAWAIALAPEDVESYAWRGYVSMRAGEYLKAQVDYGTVLELEPADFDAHNALCWSYGEGEEFERALAHCERALNVAGSLSAYANALENRCWVRVEMGAYEAAARDCVGVLEIAPDCGEVCALAHYNLGRVRLSQGRQALAAQHFRRGAANRIDISGHVFGNWRNIRYTRLSLGFRSKLRPISRVGGRRAGECVAKVMGWRRRLTAAEPDVLY